MKIVIVTPAHNEENTIAKCLESVKALEVPDEVKVEHIVVLDRCIDGTRIICQKYDVKTLIKDWGESSGDPVGEVVDFALKDINADLVAVVDADVQMSRDVLTKLLPHLNDDVVCVSAIVKSRAGKKYLDVLMWIRDLSYRIAPLGRKIYGACCLFRREVIKKIGGIDLGSPRWETGFELRLKAHGYKTKVVNVTVLEYRERTVRSLIERQISDGKARRRMQISFLRTLLHAIFRGRPFVLWGYLVGKSD